MVVTIDRRSLLLGLAASAALPRFSWAAAARATGIEFPAGLAPRPLPTAALVDGSLPRADVVVMCDTVDEARATADVLTPGVGPESWMPYVKNFTGHFLRQVGPNGPSRRSKRLGSFCMTQIGPQLVLVYKTELHLHTDARPAPDGGYTMPIAGMLNQIIGDARPSLFLTTGTAGGVYPSMDLGDVVVSRAARFHCERDFAKAPFNGRTFTSNWKVPIGQLTCAEKLMSRYAPHLTGLSDPRGMPPVPDCSAPGGRGRNPQVHLDGYNRIPAFHPILTTDVFEFGTSANRLDKIGMAVEMDDAVLGLVCSEMNDPPHWACVRNLSDPTINGALSAKVQGACAVYYYSKFGYWTTVNSALTSWAIAAAL